MYGSFYFIEYVGDALISGYLRPLSISTPMVTALIKLIELFSYFRYADVILYSLCYIVSYNKVDEVQLCCFQLLQQIFN